MRKSTRVSLAIGVLALTVGLAVALRWSHSPQQPPAPKSPPRALRLSTGLLVPAPAPPPSGSLRIRGVVLEDGRPVEGVRVAATRPEPGQTLSELTCAQVLGQPELGDGRVGCPSELDNAALELLQAREGEAPTYAETTTAADGGFTLEGLPGGDFTLWAVGGRGGVVRSEVAAGTEGVELVLRDGSTLEGRVMSEDGHPLAGVQVTAVYRTPTRFFDTKTGPDGRYRLGPLPFAPAYDLAFVHEGWLPVLFSTGMSQHEQVMLFRPRRLSGRVLSSGVPAPGVEVRVYDVLESRRPAAVLRADAEGRFSAEGLLPRAHRLTAALERRHALLTVELEAPSPPPEVVLELGSAFPLEGTVRDTAGAPVAGARVTLEALKRGPPEYTHATTDASGRYRFEPRPAGSYSFGVSAPRYADLSDHEQQLGPDTGPVDFTLAPAPFIEGLAVDEEGRPVSGAVIELRNPAREAEMLREFGHDVDVGSEATCHTDEEGRFVVNVPAPGAFTLVAERWSGFVVEPLPVQAPATGVRLVLRRGARVSGTVTDERGAPVAHAWVKAWLADSDSDEVAQARVDARGRFSLTGLPPGRYMVEATHQTAAVERSGTQPVELRESEAKEVVLRLENGWTLSGLVVDGHGQPLPGVRVQPSTPQDALPEWRRGLIIVSTGPVPSITTGPDGRFTLRHLPGREVELDADKEGYRFVPSRSLGGRPVRSWLQVHADSGDVRLVLVRLPRVRGRLTGPDGAPVHRFFVNGFEVADTRGVFDVPLEDPAEGRVRFYVMDDVPDTVRHVEARDGMDVDLGEVRMGLGRRVRGQVLDALTSEPVKGAQVAADDPLPPGDEFPPHPSANFTDAEGRFELTQVEERPLSLFVQAQGYRPHQLALGAGDEEGVMVRLDRGAQVELTTRDAQGRPVPARARLEREGADGSLKYLELPEGSLVLSALKPGSYHVYAFPLGESTVSFPPHTLQVPASGRVALTVVARSTSATLVVPLKERVYDLFLLQGSVPLPRDSDIVGVRGRALGYVSTADRTVMYRNLPPGRYTLFLWKLSGNDIHREELDLPAEGTVVHEVTPRWQPVVADEP